ncbi:Levansucrase protein [Spatholobus suberectus]|nr:Levansucrase protein [Spatholobus suberectus]
MIIMLCPQPHSHSHSNQHHLHHDSALLLPFPFLRRLFALHQYHHLYTSVPLRFLVPHKLRLFRELHRLLQHDVALGPVLQRRLLRPRLGAPPLPSPLRENPPLLPPSSYGKKNCYSFPSLPSPARYLLRTFTVYDNYDAKSRPPSFDAALASTVLFSWRSPWPESAARYGATPTSSPPSPTPPPLSISASTASPPTPPSSPPSSSSSSTPPPTTPPTTSSSSTTAAFPAAPVPPGAPASPATPTASPAPGSRTPPSEPCRKMPARSAWYRRRTRSPAPTWSLISSP